MTMNDAIASVFKNYANFNGRARRKEYWYFMLLDFIINFLSAFIVIIFPPIGLSCVSIWWVATLLPRLAVTWRRLHDTGKSGAWFLLSVTGIGSIVLLIWLTEDSMPGDNLYGQNPKGVRALNINNNRNNFIPSSSVLAVQCINGPLQGQTYRIGQGLTFGTDVQSSVRFPIGTPGVSRNHCEIRWQNGSLMLIDVGSTYGTYVANGKKLPMQYPEMISQGSNFYLGGQGIMFQVISAQM